MSTFEDDMKRPDDFFDFLLEKFSTFGFSGRRVSKHRVDIVPTKVVSTQKKTAPTITTVQKEKFAHERG